MGAALACGNEVNLVHESTQACKEVFRMTRKYQQSATANNPSVLSAMLESELLSRAKHVPVTIRWYLSIEDGECSVEHDFEGVRPHICEKTNVTMGLANDLGCLMSAGCSAEDIAKPATGRDGTALVLGAVGLECANM